MRESHYTKPHSAASTKFGVRRGRPTNLFPLEALERALPQQPFRRDVPVLDIREEGRFDPRGLRLLDRLRQLGFRAHDGIKLFPDLARDGARPAGPDLAHVDEILSFSLSEIQRGHAGGILDEADDGEFALLHGLDLQPAFVPIGAVGSLRILRDDALEVQFRGVLEHLLSVAGQVLGIDDRMPDVVFPEQVGEHSLALHLRKSPEIAVPPEQVECVVDQPVLSASSEFGLKFGEVGAALVDDDHFAVEDRLAGDVKRAGDHGEALRPVQPVAGEYTLFSLVQMNLNPVTVELDFVEPLVAGRRLGLQRGQLRLDEPRHFRRGGRRNHSPRTFRHHSKTPAYRVILKGTRGSIMKAVIRRSTTSVDATNMTSWPPQSS